MKRKILIISIISLLVITSIITGVALAVPPSNPHIESGTADQGGRFFQYYSDGIYRDLKTPPHWVIETGELAYCLEHTADSAHGDLYYGFDAESLYSNKTYKGLMAIMMNGYPYTNAGLTDQQARYATANAIRSWLCESAGIGYNYMLPSNNYIRHRSGYGSVLTFYWQLLVYARAGESAFVQYSLNVSPSTVTLTEQNGQLEGTVTVNTTKCNNYTIDEDKLPAGVTISGYTGNTGDVLTITAPIEYKGHTEILNDIFEGNTNRGSVNFFWLDTSSGKQSVVVPAIDVYSPAVFGSLEFTSEKPTEGFIEIFKTDENTGAKLQGAVFKILNDSNLEVERLTTNSNGYAKSGAIVEGIYSIHEITAPSGYVLDTTLHENINVTADNTITLNLTNKEQTGTITVIKYDNETDDTPQGQATLNGAVFKISRVIGNPLSEEGIGENDLEFIEEIDCGDNNTATSTELPLGLYLVEETKAPKGYNLGDNFVLIEVTGSSTSTAPTQFYNEVIKGIIAITKRVDEPLAIWESEEYEYPLEGIGFEVRAKGTDELVASLYTDIYGYVESNPLPYGTYIVSEPHPPVGYIGIESFEVVIDTDGEIHEFEITNHIYQANITIEKKDKDTGEIIPIAGTEFRILDIHNEPVELDGKKVFSTDDTGTINVSEPLKYGDYRLQEIKSPHGYWLDDEPIPFNVWDNEPISIEFNNTKILKQIQVIKTDSRDDKRLLSGAVYEIYRNNELVETITTDNNGQAITSMLPVGEYQVIEVIAPTGFVLGDNTFDVTISDDNEMIHTIECENDPTEVVLMKSDIADDKPLTGAIFEVYNKDNEVVAKGETDKEGNLVIWELHIGKYTFNEIVAPIGYALEPNVFSFEILRNGTITGDTKIQNLVTEVTISKNDFLDNRSLPNAVIEIINSEGEVVFTGKTDDNGEITILKLPFGTYTFKEIEAPAGYILCENTFTFTIDEYGAVTGETVISNCPTMLEIHKVIYETNEPLTGAGFRIKNFLGLNTLTFTKNEDGTYRLDKDGDIIEILVGGDGTATIYGLPFGNYWLEESTVPTGYYPTAAVKVKVDSDSTIDMPYVATIPNSEFVKLGLDRDKYRIPITIGLVILIIGGLVFFFVRKKRKT